MDETDKRILNEIQTGNFSSLKKKLRALVGQHRVRLVFPVAGEKWIVRLNADLTKKSRRKSPKHGRAEEVYKELVAFPDLLGDPHFELEVLVVQQEEFRSADGRGSWRRNGTSIVDSRLLNVTERRLFTCPADVAASLPDELPEPFSTLDLSKGLAIPRWLAQKMAYCLRVMGAADLVGKDGNALLYVPVR